MYRYSTCLHTQIEYDRSIHKKIHYKKNLQKSVEKKYYQQKKWQIFNIMFKRIILEKWQKAHE